MSSFLSIAPLIPAGADLTASIRFYTEQMGFHVSWEGGGGAGIKRDQIELILVQNANQEWAENASFSIGVSDLDALYLEYKGIQAKVGPLEMKGWGRREFHLQAPPGVCYQFFQKS